MTNAQKWIAVFLALFIALFVLNKVTTDDSGEGPIEFYSGEQTMGGEGLKGIELIKSINCTSCHGGDLRGTKLAPGLYDAKNHWSRNELINYLRNPSAYDGDERFDAYKDKYSATVMPSYANRDVKELGKIADYLLDLK